MKSQPFVGVCIAIFIIILTQKLPAAIKMVWGYFLFFAAYQAFWPLQSSTLLAWNSAEDLFLLLVFPLVILHSSDHVKNYIIAGTKWYLTYDAVTLLFGKSGVFSATTFDASLIACFILFWDLKKKRDRFGLFISLAAIAFVQGRNAALILSISSLILLVQVAFKYLTKNKFIIFIGALSVALSATAFIITPYALHDVRFRMWENFFNWWMPRANHWIGAGIGTFEWIGPYIPPIEDFKGKGVGFFVMHNDWAQMVFELGIIGTTLAGATYIYIARKLKGRDFATWIAVGAGMTFYYVSHAWPVQLLMLILMSRAFKTIDHKDLMYDNSNKPTKRRFYDKFIFKVHSPS